MEVIFTLVWKHLTESDALSNQEQMSFAAVGPVWWVVTICLGDAWGSLPSRASSLGIDSGLHSEQWKVQRYLDSADKMFWKHFHGFKPLVILQQRLFNEILSFIVSDSHVSIHCANFLYTAWSFIWLSLTNRQLFFKFSSLNICFMLHNSTNISNIVVVSYL